MPWHALLVAVTLLAGPPKAEPEELKEQMSEAIRRHDGGDYAGAMTIYRGLLTKFPHHADVVYELSLSMRAAEVPSKEVIAFIEGELKSDVPQLPQVYSTLAAALDAEREFAKGEAALRKGLALEPENADLQFNLGINLCLQKRCAEAVGPLGKAVHLAPRWASTWYATAEAMTQAGHPARAFFATARFVAVEPDSARGQAAAQKLWPLLMGGVTKKSKKEVTVGAAAGTENLGMSLLAATRFTEDWEKKSDGAFFAHALGEATQLQLELKADPFYDDALALFAEAKKAGLVEALAWELRRAAGDAEAGTWFSAHRAEEKSLQRFLRPYRAR